MIDEQIKPAATQKDATKQTYPKASRTALIVNGTKMFPIDEKTLAKLPDPFTFMDMLEFVKGFVPGFEAISTIIISGMTLNKKEQAGYAHEVFDMQNGSICVLGDEVHNASADHEHVSTSSFTRTASPPRKQNKKAGTAESLGIVSTSSVAQVTASVPNAPFDPATLKKYHLDKLLQTKTGPLRGSAQMTREQVRSILMEHIRSYNQLRDLEDKNLENMKNLKYSTKNDKLKQAAEVLMRDDVGGFVYADVQGYELEGLVEIATFLEDKPMEVEDWVHLYKHLVDYFGD